MSSTSTQLVLTEVEGEPRIKDLDLAVRLCFERPRVIRDLIRRYLGTLETFGVCRTVRQTSGRQGGRPGTEFYLNQEQAIFICMKSETSKAVEVQIEIVQVYVAYLRGAAPQTQSPLTPMQIVAAMANAAVEQERRLVLVEQEQLRQAEVQEEHAEQLQQIETARDHYTILGWWRSHYGNAHLRMSESARMGRIASAYCRGNGIAIDETPDPRFGRANVYPRYVLDELFLPVQRQPRRR